jgi:hypothetical protein
VAEWSERYASGTKPKTPLGFQAFSAGRLLGAVRIVLIYRLQTERPEGEVWSL